MIAKSLGTIACVALLGVAGAEAQQYPQKPISVIVPFAAGGPTDTVARLLGVAMGKSLKTQILVENVGGAGGTDRGGARGEGPARRVHDPAPSHRPGRCAGALPEAPVRRDR